MQIYTGTCAGDKLEKAKQYKLGIMISPSPTFEVRPTWKDLPCALDNGAFQSHRRGFPFMEQFFLEALESCYTNGLSLDFVVCPDIICGGVKSLDFSLAWAERLATAPRLALVLQDGMQEGMLDPHILSKFTHLFIGGSVEWKWENADRWVRFAHAHNKLCHIGQVGRADRLRFAQHIQADSVDSTSIARNDSWDVLDEYYGKHLFD